MKQTTEPLLDLTSSQLRSILLNFKIEFERICPEHPIQGSPERVNKRLVIQDTNNDLYLLEEIHPKHLQRKQRIAQTLEILTQQQIPYVFCYHQTTTNTYQVAYNNSYYQLSSYLKGTPLNRPYYIQEPWRGEKTAQFLICLQKATIHCSPLLSKEHFNLSAYLHTTITQMKHHHPNIASQIQHITDQLQQQTLCVLETLPTTFSHGDLHPLNIIWSDTDITAIIDWEFCSYKTELYDSANLLGCLGIEHPSGLLDNYATRFIETIQELATYSKESYKHLLYLIISLRIAWLTEWIKKQDEDMILLEIDYINLLFRNKDYLTEQLGIKQ